MMNAVLKPFVAAIAWVTCALLAFSHGHAAGQLGSTFFDASEHPAIQYQTSALTDAVARLRRRLQDGQVRLEFDERTGYLRSLLRAMDVPVDTQLAVFAKTSLQSQLISPRNPRVIFFNDSVAVAWPRGGFIEIAAQDPRQGVVFYALEQRPVATPQFIRPDACLRCHYSYATLGVPGMLVRSVAAAPNGGPLPHLANYTLNHASPMAERWAGWYVTGRSGTLRHLGNLIVKDPDVPNALEPHTSSLESLSGEFDTGEYLAPYSDIAALMVFDHQMHMMNLLTRVGWEARVALADKRGDLGAVVRESARELVDYMLFVDEAPLASPIVGTSGFTARFSAAGPVDSKGRSLRQLDLGERLMRYRCSYLIYSEAFDSLPAESRSAIYERLWQVLSGLETNARYSRMPVMERRAIVEILRETKKDLPPFFR